MEVGEGDLAIETAIGDEGKEPLERDRVIVELQSAIREMGPTATRA
jgi:hypothetical protein